VGDQESAMSKEESRELCQNMLDTLSSEPDTRRSLIEFAHHRDVAPTVLGSGGGRDVHLTRSNSLARRHLIDLMLEDRHVCHLVARLRTDIAERAISLLKVGDRRLASLQEELGPLDAMWTILASKQTPKPKIVEKMCRDAYDAPHIPQPEPEESTVSKQETPDKKTSRKENNTIRELTSRVKELKRESKSRLKQVRTQSTTIGRLKEELEQAKEKTAYLTAEHKQDVERLHTAHSTKRRESTRVKSLVSQLKSDRQQLETELQTSQGFVAELQEQLERADELTVEQEERVREIEDRLVDTELEVLESLIGADRDKFEAHTTALAASAETQKNILRRVDAIRMERKQSLEIERTRIEAEKQYEEESAKPSIDEGLLVAEQMDVVWLDHERKRAEDAVTAWEKELLRDGIPAHLFIDGHNVILRKYSKSVERTSRQWLQARIVEMSDRLSIRTHLVFDTKYSSNEYSLSPNVRCYFASQHDEGGADGAICTLIREHANGETLMVCSSDYKHVWRDAIDAREKEGIPVEPIAAELLHHYLVAVEDLERLG